MRIENSKWKLVKLGDIFKISSGGTPLKSKPEYYENGTIGWVRTGDLKNKYITKIKGLITEEALNNSSAKLFPFDTVLIAMYGATIGACSILSVKAATNQACAAFLPSKEVESSYLYYFFCSKKNDFIKMGVGGAQPNISATILKGVQMPLPPLETQKQISKTLDTISELLAMRKQQLAELDSLIKSTFYDMFGDPVTNEKGWRIEKLKDFATLLNGRAYNQDELLKDGKTPVLRVGNFFSNRGWYFSDLELGINKYCDKGDLLYAWSASFGPKIWDGPKVIFHYHIWKILLNDEVNKQFVFSLLKYATEKLKEGTHGIAMMHLTKGGMEQTDFIVPTLSLQTQFAEIVTKIEEQKALVKKAIDEIQVLFDSLMCKYFE